MAEFICRLGTPAGEVVRTDVWGLLLIGFA
jgi:hypothetical protein